LARRLAYDYAGRGGEGLSPGHPASAEAWPGPDLDCSGSLLKPTVFVFDADFGAN
jgi:hypothetical protein